MENAGLWRVLNYTQLDFQHRRLFADSIEPRPRHNWPVSHTVDNLPKKSGHRLRQLILVQPIGFGCAPLLRGNRYETVN